eukprot:gene19636-21579_t
MLADIKSFSEEQDISPVIEHTVTLKRHLIAEFGDEIAFFPSGKYIIVHASSINPYSVATLQGRCLRDEDFVRSFSYLIRLKSKQLASNENLDLGIQLDADPLPEIYNVIYASKYGSNYQVNDSGYAITKSKNIATRVWSIASDWQSFVTGEKSYKQVVLGKDIQCQFRGLFDPEMPVDDDVVLTTPEYSIGQRKAPPLFKDHVDREDNDLLLKSLMEDIIWAIANGIPSSETDPLPLLGSWTAFRRPGKRNNERNWNSKSDDCAVSKRRFSHVSTCLSCPGWKH